MDPGHDRDHRHDDREQEQRPCGPVPAERVADGPDGDDHRVVAIGLVDAQRPGHLLQEDDRRDPERESFDQRPRDERQIAAEPGDTGGEDQHACHQPDQEHPVDPVAGDDRDQHHGHRSCRSRHLHVRATEHGRHQTGHDRGHQPGVGAEPGRDAERQRKRERDDADGDARDHIRTPRPRQPGVVRPSREQPSEQRARRRRGLGVGFGGRPERRAHRRSSSSSPASTSTDSLSDEISIRLATLSRSTSRGSRIE